VLEALHIRGYALIDAIDLTFGPGLTAITGETGSGKSIVIGALGVALGARISAEEIRSGSDVCEVTAVFDPPKAAEIDRWLRSRSIELDAEALFMRRVARRRGRGAAFVQSVPVPLSEYAELGRMLLAIHGQHQHQALLSSAEQRRLLDRYADVEEQVAAIAADTRSLTELGHRLDGLRADLERAEHDRELLQHATSEIDEAELRDGEEQELLDRQRVLRSMEQIQRLLAAAKAATSETQGGAGANLRAALQAIGELAAIDGRFDALAQQVETVLYEVEDITDALGKAESETVEPGELLAVEDRLAAIRSVTRKYGGTEAAALAHADDCRRRLDSLVSAGEEISGYVERTAAVERSLRAAATAVSVARQRAATDLARSVQEELRRLGMPRARFAVAVTPRPEGIGATGADAVEFLLEANPGEGLAPLRSVAAGGELSRVMLALNAVPARAGGTATAVFDEIDAGVGGQIGVAIGERLRRIAERQQVLCITHLATVAARADAHLRIEKRTSGERSLVIAAVVDGTARVDELARMLAGDHSEGATQRHAAQLLETARRPV
jgi:DNA repair protein RecN (Recombination protein N)